MKKNVIKTVFAAVCVAAAGMSAFKAYDKHNENLAVADVLLAENVEALSAGDSWLSGAINTITGIIGGIIGGGNGQSEEKWYRAECNEPCSFYKSINGKDALVNGTKKGCEDTKAQTAGCHIPNYNPCQE